LEPKGAEMLNVPKALSLDAEGVQSKILIKGGRRERHFPHY